MITYILTGVLLGMVLSAIGMYVFTFVAKRQGWLDVRVAPGPHAGGGSLDRVALERVTERLEELESCYQDTLGLVQALTDIRQHKQE